jgi:hypothetical protein
VVQTVSPSLPAPPGAAGPRRSLSGGRGPDERWLKVAQGLALVVGLSIPAFIGFGLTIGLITGLVVLVAPFYVLGFQMGLTALVVSLCLWRRRYGVARVLGTPLVLVPGCRSRVGTCANGTAAPSRPIRRRASITWTGVRCSWPSCSSRRS